MQRTKPIGNPLRDQACRAFRREYREQIRLAFHREYGHLLGSSPVSVQRHPDTGEWCVHVGAVGSADLPTSYFRLPVIVHRTTVAMHAAPDPAA